LSAPASRRDFFALEAGEYLERLTQLVGGETAPDPESLVRFARALRGAAFMAGPPGYAVAAAAIEQASKAVRDGSTRWSPALAECLREALAAGQQLLRRLREWSEQDIARCERVASELGALLGGLPRRSHGDPAATAPTQSAAVRAFIARETAALAGTLGQAATALDAADSSAAVALESVSHRLQPLRGLGALPSLAPLPELLEALDVTLAFGGRSGAWPRGAAPAFRAASLALARLARDIAALGLPQPEAREITEVSSQLREAFGDERDVVPIASLFAGADPAPVVRLGTPLVPRAPAPDLKLELLGLADRLQEASAQLRSGPPGVARALRLYSLVLSLRGLRLSPAAAGSAGNLLCRLDRETMAGRALDAPGRLVDLLERAARMLADAAESGTVARLGAMLAPLCEELDRQAGVAEAVVPIESLASEPELDVVPIESLAPEPEPDVVPIESLAPEREVEIVPIESLGYDVAPVYTAFEQSFSTYFRLQQEAMVVPIDSLMYRGKRALERADLVRRELTEALRSEPQLPELRLLLGELLDLVPLALDEQR
jgi:HPt (histidine-containing phosphotransfer) domain-containing protein